MSAPRQWDVWWAELRTGRKREQTGDHHVLILSDDLVINQTGMVIVAPITTSGSNRPWVVAIDPSDAGIRARSWIECHQLQALALSRLIEFRRRLVETRRPYVALALRSVLRLAVGDLA